jgi:hypothetical protein
MLNPAQLEGALATSLEVALRVALATKTKLEETGVSIDLLLAQAEAHEQETQTANEVWYEQQKTDHRRRFTRY